MACSCVREKGVFAGQGLHDDLALGDDGRNVGDEVRDLRGQQRDEGQQQHGQEEHEEPEDEANCQQPRPAEAHQKTHHPFQQEGDDHAGDDRCQEIAHGQDDGCADADHQQEDDQLRVREDRVQPFAEKASMRLRSFEKVEVFPDI